MVAPRTWLSLLLVGMSGYACSSHETAPPLAKCGADGCNPATGINSSLASGGSSSVSDAGGAGNGISLTVTAVAFTDSSADSLAWSLSGVRSLSDIVEVAVPSVIATILTNTGSGPLTFTGVITGDQAWASASPTTTGSIYLPGIVGLANPSGSSVSIPLLLTDDFAFIPSLLNAAAPSLDRTKAQVVVKVVDGQGNGVRNARIADLGAAAMAYSSAGSWVDTSLSPYTDASGRVIGINIPAPLNSVVGLLNVTASGLDTSGDSVTASIFMPIEVGFVTYGTIVLPLS
jgi:hypothetical protein